VRLCYIEGCWAYFTSLDLEEQWGDDWDDAPYEHNAGRPYTWVKWHDGDKMGRPEWFVTKVAWDAPYETPAEVAGGNSRYSVRHINRQHVPWLTPSRWGGADGQAPIFAGVTLGEFRGLIRAAGGQVYEVAP
jgi:hypothetical protein